MNSQLNTLARRSQAAYAQAPGARPGGQPASGAETGTAQAAALDLETLDLARIHERVEMVRGNFAVGPAPGQGTTIRAQIPFHNGG